MKARGVLHQRETLRVSEFGDKRGKFEPIKTTHRKASNVPHAFLLKIHATSTHVLSKRDIQIFF